MMDNAAVVRVRRGAVETVLAVRCCLGRKGKLFSPNDAGQRAANDVGTLYLAFEDAEGFWDPTYGDLVWVLPDDRPERGPFALQHILEEGFGTDLGHFVIDLSDYAGGS